jgi:hypothetical protein
MRKEEAGQRTAGEVFALVAALTCGLGYTWKR